MTDVHFLPPHDVARSAVNNLARSKTHHGAGDRQLDGAAGSKLPTKEFVSVRLPQLPGAVQERYNALKMTRGHGAFGPRLTMFDTMMMKQKLMEEHVQHLTDEYNNVKAVADSRAKQLDVMMAQASSTSDVCGEITELSSNMEVYMTALQQRCDVVCTRLDDTHTHMECMRANAERLNASNRAVKVRTDAIKNEIAKGDAKFKEARRLHQVLGKASQAAQEEFHNVRSLLLAEADERQAQLDHRTSIWQFQQQQATEEERARTADEEARARAALTTASSLASAREEKHDAAVELEQMLVARAPLQEQLKWDRQQPNTVVAGMARLEGTFGCTGAEAVIQRYDSSRQRLQQLEQLRGDLETRTEALGKRRDDLQNLLNGLRMGVVSASSEESRSGLDDDAQELARFAKDIDYAPVRVSAQDERLTAAAATIARLQPSVARFDSMFLQLRHWLDTMAAKLDVPLQAPTQQPDEWCNSSLSLLSDRLLHMKSRLEGAGVPVSTIPIQPLGMSVLEGSVSPGYRRRLVQLAASLSPCAELGAAQDEDACATDVDAASPSHHQPSPPTVPPIDLSNFVVTMSMASHSLQSPPRFDSRIDGVVPGSPRGMPVWDFKAQMQQDALENNEEEEGSDDDAALDVLFNDDGSRNVPCRDEEELARDRERKLRLTDKQMGEVLRTVPKVPPKPRQRGDFNSAM